MPLVSVARVRKLLKYNSTAGELSWKVSRGSVSAGKAIGARLHRDGYQLVRIDGTLHRAHRVVWLLYYGVHPKGEIDHKNGVRHDNRICNLRDIPKAQNQKNMKRRSDNTSGATGVMWSKQRNKWQATIYKDRRTIHLGFFTCFKEAAAVRKRAEREYGFHPNHGRVQ